jgi:hypothetical protein
MKHFYLFILVVIASMSSLLASCQTVEPVTDFDELIDRLSHAGAMVEITVDTVRYINLSVQGIITVVDGEDVQVFEYEDVDRAQIEFVMLTGSGPRIGFFVEDEPPVTEEIIQNRKCYYSGRFILLYDGEDVDVLKILRVTLGRPLPLAYR